MSLAKVILEEMNPLKEEESLVKEWEYLIHHLHEGDKIEDVHHCPMVDHLGNLYEVEHIETSKGIRHALKGLVKDQKVFWSDADAKKDGKNVPCANRQLD
jgi:hypothetical protein